MSEIIRSEITHAELITQHRSGSEPGSLGAERGGEPGHQGGQGRGSLVPLCCGAGAQSIFSIPGGFGEAARCCVPAALVLQFGEAAWHRAAVLGEKPCPAQPALRTAAIKLRLIEERGCQKTSNCFPLSP